MDVISLFAGENLYKYMVLGGVLLIATVYFPIEKANELELEINKINFEEKLLKWETDNISSEMERRNVKTSFHLKNMTKDSDVDQAKTQIFSESELFYQKIDSLAIKLLQLEFHVANVASITRQISQYRSISIILGLLGLILLILGLVHWYRIMPRSFVADQSNFRIKNE